MAEKTVSIGGADGGSEYPVMSGTLGPDVIDIRKFYGTTDQFTYDPGFTSTASCESKITFIDGDKGILLHRGYPIDDLADKSDFLETCYLLLNGELPNGVQKDKFVHDITYHSMVHEQLAQFYKGFRRDAHPMAIMVGVVGALSSFYHDSTDIDDPHQRMVASYRLIAKMPTIAAWAYKYSIGQPFMYPRNDLSYAEDFLHLMFAVPCEEYVINPVVSKAMDRILILHADHEQNCSTSTVRMVASSGANLFASISAGIAALWGPLHGGANQAVIEMLEKIHAGNLGVKKCIEMAKDKESGFRLMGFGHRVYKNFDPRAQILKELSAKVFDVLKHKDPLLDIARELEDIALNDPYFIERKLYPNIDFYSGIIFRAVGVPTNMYPVFFAIGRLPGWIAHWREATANNKLQIARPRQIYTGPSKQSYIPVDQRPFRQPLP